MKQVNGRQTNCGSVCCQQFVIPDFVIVANAVVFFLLLL